MRRIRVFIGIDPGKAIRDRLAGLQKALIRDGADAKWVEVENLHLTLLFLGEVDLLTVPKLCELVQETIKEHAVFPMTIEHVGCFPNPRRPKVLWVGVGQGLQEVTAIHDALEQPLFDLGCYRREDRKYTPHLTLGRGKGEQQRGDLGTILPRYADWKAGETTVNAIQVMSSELTPEGPIYTVLSRARLA